MPLRFILFSFLISGPSYLLSVGLVGIVRCDPLLLYFCGLLIGSQATSCLLPVAFWRFATILASQTALIPAFLSLALFCTFFTVFFSFKSIFAIEVSSYWLIVAFALVLVLVLVSSLSSATYLPVSSLFAILIALLPPSFPLVVFCALK